MKIFIVGTHEVVSYMYHYCNCVLLISAITLLMNCSERKKIYSCRVKNSLVSKKYFVASELRPAVVFNFVFQRPRGSHSRLLPGVSF